VIGVNCVRDFCGWMADGTRDTSLSNEGNFVSTTLSAYVHVNSTVNNLIAHVQKLL